MFESLSERLGGVFDRLRGRGALNEADVREAMREVRVALLEADVALPVVRTFIDKVTDHPTEALSKLRGVGADNKFGVRVAAHQICWEQITAKLGLTMTGRHRDHQAFALARNDTVKSFGDSFVVFPDKHLGPDVLAERQEVSGCTLLCL